MRTTITVDDDLFKDAEKATGSTNASEVVKIALKRLVAAESRKRLIALGGSAPDFSVPGREVATAGPPIGLVAEDRPSYNSK